MVCRLRPAGRRKKQSTRQSQSSYLIYYLHTASDRPTSAQQRILIGSILLRLSTETMSGANAGNGAVNHIASWRSEMAHIHATELTRLHRSKFQLSSGQCRVSRRIESLRPYSFFHPQSYLSVFYLTFAEKPVPLTDIVHPWMPTR